MFASLEKKVAGLCIAILLAIVIVGNIFGGSMKGLFPLGACVASGVWLFMKEVVRSGREVEWDSEKVRGETASIQSQNYESGVSLNVLPRQPPTFFPSLSNG